MGCFFTCWFISADWIVMKIVSQICLWTRTRKSLLNFGSHPDPESRSRLRIWTRFAVAEVCTVQVLWLCLQLLLLWMWNSGLWVEQVQPDTLWCGQSTSKDCTRIQVQCKLLHEHTCKYMLYDLSPVTVMTLLATAEMYLSKCW